MLSSIICFSVAKTTTATVGTWSPAGDPATGDDVTISHDWSAGWAATGGIASAFSGTITIENGGHLRITNALANFAGTMTIESGGNYEIDGDMTNWTGAIDIQSGGVFTSHYDFDAGDDASGAALTVNGELILTGSSPQGVLTLDLIVAGTGRIYARSIVLNGNGSTGGATLPVELIMFIAKSNKSGNELLWTTASEVNNSHFDIEKSLNGIDFYTIDQVQGNGNSSDEINYSYFDSENLGENVYYRLKQVDFDGAINYSHVVNTFSNKKSIEIVQQGSSSNFFILSPSDEELFLKVFDISGRLILQESFITFEGSRYNFKLQHTGNLILTIQSNQSTVSKKAIIK
tara:strand:- start:997 stop:2034 length:1038 start_codon:yes stop_codon:yes gene_type:complete